MCGAWDNGGRLNLELATQATELCLSGSFDSFLNIRLPPRVLAAGAD
jgi:hypothetical protein